MDAVQFVKGITLNISTRIYFSRRVTTRCYTRPPPILFSSSHVTRYIYFRHEPEGWGFESLAGRDIFGFKIFDIFFRTSARYSKMNAVARGQSTFQMLVILQKYLYHQSRYSTKWDSKGLALITQMIRAFAMKVWGSSPHQVETFYLKIVDAFTRTSVRESKINDITRAKLLFQMLTSLRKT